jgi:hypothetical protein
MSSTSSSGTSSSNGLHSAGMSGTSGSHSTGMSSTSSEVLSSSVGSGSSSFNS